MQQTTEHRRQLSGLGRVMKGQQRGPLWVADRLREHGIDVDRSTVHRWSRQERSAPITVIKPLASIFGVDEAAICG